jgi:hypothetical protein
VKIPHHGMKKDAGCVECHKPHGWRAL